MWQGQCFHHCSYFISRYFVRQRVLRFCFFPRPTLSFLVQTCNPCHVRPGAKQNKTSSECVSDRRQLNMSALRCWPCPEISPRSRTSFLSRLKTLTITNGEGPALQCLGEVPLKWSFLSMVTCVSAIYWALVASPWVHIHMDATRHNATQFPSFHTLHCPLLLLHSAKGRHTHGAVSP